jgi:purine-nucleoside phosphorylase
MDEMNGDEEANPHGDAKDAKRQPHRENMAVLEVRSERGFLTLTGTYKSVPISIISIGMGAPNMDFFVREGREILDEAGQDEMVIIRCVL